MNTQKQPDFVGTLCTRKRRGRKLSFMVGGAFDFDTMSQWVNWQHVKTVGTVIEFHGERLNGEPTAFSLVPPTN